jgi:hypothetical protein
MKIRKILFKFFDKNENKKLRGKLFAIPFYYFLVLNSKLLPDNASLSITSD